MGQTTMQLTAEALIDQRSACAFLVGNSKADYALTADNQVLDYSERFARYFTFHGLTGCVDRSNYVQWGGMGFSLSAIGNPVMRQTILDQTGI